MPQPGIPAGLCKNFIFFPCPLDGERFTCAPTLLSAKTGDDSVAEFVTEQAVFYQNGTWAYGDVADVGEENLGMLPIYIGVGDEANQGL